MTETKNSHDKKNDSFSDSAEMFENVFREAIAEEQKKTGKEELKKSGESVRKESKELAPESKPAKKAKIKNETKRKRKKELPRKKKPRGRTASRATLLVVLLVVLAAVYIFYFREGNLPNLFNPKQHSAPMKSHVSKTHALRKAATRRPPHASGKSSATPARSTVIKLTPPTDLKKAVKLPQTKKQEQAPSLPTPLSRKPVQTASTKAPQAKERPPKGTVVHEVKVPLYPYSIYLGAFRTLSRAKRAVTLYQKKGLNPYWVKVDLGQKGTWYRVFEGHFPKKEEAGAFIQKKRLKDAEIKATKYTNLIGVYSNKDELKRLSLELLRSGYCPYAIPASDGKVKLLTGAFYTKEGAQSLLAELASKGIKSTVVKR